MSDKKTLEYKPLVTDNYSESLMASLIKAINLAKKEQSNVSFTYAGSDSYQGHEFTFDLNPDSNLQEEFRKYKDHNLSTWAKSTADESKGIKPQEKPVIAKRKHLSTSTEQKKALGKIAVENLDKLLEELPDAAKKGGKDLVLCLGKIALNQKDSCYGRTLKEDWEQGEKFFNILVEAGYKPIGEKYSALTEDIFLLQDQKKTEASIIAKAVNDLSHESHRIVAIGRDIEEYVNVHFGETSDCLSKDTDLKIVISKN